MLPTKAEDRKERPITRGVLDYFPDAIAEIAHVSYVGNQQHNPGEPMHWAKEKSADHADCIARHLIERGKTDTDGLRHTAKAAWRALALLQMEIEDEQPGREVLDFWQRRAAQARWFNQHVVLREGAREYVKPSTQTMAYPADKLKSLEGQTAYGFPTRYVDTSLKSKPFADPRRNRDLQRLIELHCYEPIAKQIVGGITYNRGMQNDCWVYLSGPMRGIKDFNFPEFDKARNNREWNWNVISPADIDRAARHTDEELPASVYVERDLFALLFIASQSTSQIVLLPGHEKSVGATAERALAKWLGIKEVIL